MMWPARSCAAPGRAAWEARPRPRRAVFVDKDDTLVRDVAYSAREDALEWMPGALEGLRVLDAAGFEIVLVTNQSGIAHGLFSEQDLHSYLRCLSVRLAQEGLRLAGVEYCPHHPEAAVEAYRRPCVCRKPGPGMLVRAAAYHRFDLRRCWMVGDLVDDVEAGSRAGCGTALLAVHEDQVPHDAGVRCPDVVAGSLLEAAGKIVSDSLWVA